MNRYSFLNPFSYKSGNLYGMGVMRVILAISVVLTHTSSLLGYNPVGGGSAVQIFFIFSGFYMFMILDGRYTSPYKFYKSRALRLYPTYLAVAAFSVGVWYFFRQGFGPWVHWADAGLSAKVFLIVTNIVIFFQDIIMFLAIDPHTGNLYFTANLHPDPNRLWHSLVVPQAWSIGIELTFYLCVPFLVKCKTRTLCAIAGLSIAFRLYMAQKGFSDNPWNYHFSPFELALFVFGGIGYRAYQRLKAGKLMDYIAPLATILVIASVFMFQFLHVNSITKLFIYYVAIAAAIPFIFHASKSNVRDRRIGDLSYPIYISHWAIITCVNLLLGKYAPVLREKQLLCIPVIILTILASIALNRYIQAPIDAFRRKKYIPAAQQGHN